MVFFTRSNLIAEINIPIDMSPIAHGSIRLALKFVP